MSKPFDKTKPFVVKSGYFNINTPYRKARILCDDFMHDIFRNDEGYKIVPMLVVAMEKSGTLLNETIMYFHQNGNSETGTYRLVNVPVKMTAWVNVYFNPSTGEVKAFDNHYQSEELAKKHAQVTWANDEGFIVNTVPINWEE